MEIAGASVDRRAPEWVRGQLVDILNFWYPRARDQRHGGFLNQLRGDGSVFDADTKHLVASSRFVVLFAIGALAGGPDWCASAAGEALDFLAGAHRDRRHGGYYWILRGTEPADRRKQAYGHAFVLLAGAMGVKAGVPGAKDLLDDAVAIAEERLFGTGDLAINTASEDWSQIAEYRGQNANMHMCEAFIAAYEATGEAAYLDRAYRIADVLTRRTATRIGGFVWENYHADWSVDWEEAAARDGASLESRQGISPGHQAEWGKLLGILARHHDAEWLLPQAVHLYRLAWDFGWDRTHGGFHSGLARDLSVSDRTPSYWSPSEAIGGAAVLAAHTGNPDYWADYERAWDYALSHLVDARNGGWFKVPALPAERKDDRKGDLLDPDYHPANACYEVLRSFDQRPDSSGGGKCPIV